MGSARSSRDDMSEELEVRTPFCPRSARHNYAEEQSPLARKSYVRASVQK